MAGALILKLRLYKQCTNVYGQLVNHNNRHKNNHKAWNIPANYPNCQYTPNTLA